MVPLICPQSGQPLRLLPQTHLRELNLQIRRTKVHNMGGGLVVKKLSGAYIREDNKVAYPIEGTLPILLVSEAISFEQPALKPLMKSIL